MVTFADLKLAGGDLLEGAGNVYIYIFILCNHIYVVNINI